MSASLRPVHTASSGGTSLPECLTGPNSTQMLVELAHDLRSPLTAILTLTESLREGRSGPLTTSQRRQLALIHASALRLCGTTSDTLELARGDAGQDPTPTRFSLRQLLEEVRTTVLPMAEDKELPVDLQVAAGVPRAGNLNALRRALLNLATNALKVTERGSVRISAEPTIGERVQFAVRDTGPGMDLATVQTLWEPFRPTANAGRATAFSSSGLGLAICRKLVTRLGGELRVTTAVGRGSRFHFEIPLPFAP